ncbi:MAG TPA: hypothetical protein P5528_07730, partial [Steroidobacteraceae bacterium]|nr:hypothetical protein [Steroidobacteraceae bacterium]
MTPRQVLSMGIGAPIALLAILAMMILPLPAFALDVLFTFNRTDSPYPDDRSVGEALAQAARLHPTRVAVIADDRRVTYQALMDRARQQALRL